MLRKISKHPGPLSPAGGGTLPGAGALFRALPAARRRPPKKKRKAARRMADILSLIV